MAINNSSHTENPTAGRSVANLLSERNWLDYLWVIREHWLLAVVVALLAGGFFVYKKSQAVPLYRASALLIFEVQRDQVLNIQEVVDTSLGRAADYVLRNHLADLRSNTFRARVVQSLTPEETELVIRDYRVPGGKEEPNIHVIIAEANNIRQIAPNIFNFEFHHRNPQAAALLANRYSEEFNDFLLERARRRNEAALRFLRSQSEELKLRVERSELAVQRYRQERNLVSLEESQNLIVQRMKDLSANLNSARVELLNLSATIDQIKAAGNDLDALARLPSVTQMGTLPRRFETRSSLLAERQSLALRYGSRHPRMIANAAALEAIETEIRATLEKNVSDIFEQYNNLQARVANLQEALAVAEKEALELDQIAIEYNVLRRKLETDTRLFTQVHQRLNEAILASQLTDTNVRVVDQAWPPSEPFTPDFRKIYAMGAGIWLLCFLAVPFGIHYLNLNLKTAADIENLLGIPFLGEIRRLPRRLKAPHRIVLDQSDPHTAELFRQIHSQILLKTDRLENGHTFIVTSALPKEGKSFFAINLAASFSRHHHKTLLFDGDFRRPAIADRMRAELAGRDQTDRARPVAITPNFHVLPALRTTIEATEWIASREFQDTLHALQEQYDIVVIDTPPAGLFPDAGLLGNHADHFILLTQLNKHRKAALKAIVERLGQSKARILGMVVNKVTHGSARNLGAYRYADYKKYKSYYPAQAAAGS